MLKRKKEWKHIFVHSWKHYEFIFLWKFNFEIDSIYIYICALCGSEKSILICCFSFLLHLKHFFSILWFVLFFAFVILNMRETHAFEFPKKQIFFIILFVMKVHFFLSANRIQVKVPKNVIKFKNIE